MLAGVVGTHQNGMPRPGAELAIVPESKWRTAGDGAARFQDVEIIIERNFAEGDDHFEIGQQLQFAFEEGTAIADFVRGGLFPGGAQWHAAVI